MSVAGAAALFAWSRRVPGRDEFTVDGAVARVAGESLGDAALRAGRGFVRGAPISNALLAEGQDPRVPVRSFSPTLVRPDEHGAPVVYRARFRSSQHFEFRQMLVVRRLARAFGAPLLDYEVAVHGARTTNGREHWLTIEPTGSGKAGFSLAADGAFDPERGRLELVLIERLPGELPVRYRFEFAIDAANRFALVKA